MQDIAIPRGVLSNLKSLNKGLGKVYNLDDKNACHLGANFVFLDCPLGKIGPKAENTYEVLEEEKLIHNVDPPFPNVIDLLLLSKARLIIFIPWKLEHMVVFHYALGSSPSMVITKRWIIHNRNPMLGKTTKEEVYFLIIFKSSLHTLLDFFPFS